VELAVDADPGDRPHTLMPLTAARATTPPSALPRDHAAQRTSQFVEALAHKVIDAGMRVAWFTLESLTATVGRVAVDGTVAKTIVRIARAELIVVDDIGMLPTGQAAGEVFYRLVDAAYERRSVAVTSNIHPRASKRSCPGPLRRPPSTGSCAPPMSCSPRAPACA
jgi:hypothetical protein